MPNFSFGYCGNVHPSLSAEGICRSLETFALPLMKQVPNKGNLGVGLWFCPTALAEVLHEATQVAFTGWLKSQGLSVLCINGFPAMDFHQNNVKYKVYLPDWSSKERLTYSLQLLELGANLPLTDRELSISTLPLGYRRLSENLNMERVISLLMDWVVCAHRVEQNSGVQAHLAMEPEPGCLIETCGDLVRFFKQHLLATGAKKLQQQLGTSDTEACEILFKHVRVCMDLCHLAVMRESPADSLCVLANQGIRVGRVQVSNAIKFKTLDGRVLLQEESLHKLQNLAEDKYLHQVSGWCDDGQSVFYDDLSVALPMILTQKLSGEFVVHYHVPIYASQFEGMSTTQECCISAIEAFQRSAFTPVWEVETYTWPQLTCNATFAQEEIKSGLNNELTWLYQRMMGEKH